MAAHPIVIEHDACRPFAFVDPEPGAKIWWYVRVDQRRYSVSPYVWGAKDRASCDDWWAYIRKSHNGRV